MYINCEKQMKRKLHVTGIVCHGKEGNVLYIMKGSFAYSVTFANHMLVLLTMMMLRNLAAGRL